MIETIRKKLVRWYTFIIAFILVICFVFSYLAYRYSSISLTEDSLRDYLDEEVWEAGEYLRQKDVVVDIHKNTAGIHSLHNLTYWFVDKKLVLAETPSDDVVAAELVDRLSREEYVDRESYRIKAGEGPRRWRFLMLKQSFVLDDAAIAEVFVLTNYTPVRYTIRMYIWIALVALFVLVFLSYLSGNWVVAYSMKYIEMVFQKQKNFVANAAHELRTPLAILLSFVELLEYRPHDKKVLRDIKDEISQMSLLIDSLMMMARYDNSVMPMHKERVLLNELLRGAVDAFNSSNTRQAIHTDFVKEDVFVSADTAMLRQLLYILLDNAFKYTSEDKKIMLSLKTVDNEVQISVADNGCGIAKADLEHIFERFWRADKSRHQEGLGLGLCLAKMIATLHKGRIEVKSELQKGTTFTVRLPFV